MKYPYIARSTSDPNCDKGGLGYNTFEEAEHHANAMNQMINEYPNSPWNTEFWKTKPEPWKVFKE